jgi:hypothetical protein
MASPHGECRRQSGVEPGSRGTGAGCGAPIAGLSRPLGSEEETVGPGHLANLYGCPRAYDPSFGNQGFVALALRVRAQLST